MKEIVYVHPESCIRLLTQCVFYNLTKRRVSDNFEFDHPDSHGHTHYGQVGGPRLQSLRQSDSIESKDSNETREAHIAASVLPLATGVVPTDGLQSGSVEQRAALFYLI